MSKKTDNYFLLRLEELTRWKVEGWYKRDGCDSRNAFVEKAVNFYADYLESQENSILPAAIQSAINGRLEMFEDRMSRTLYKLTVEMDMGMSAAIECARIDSSYLREMRSDSVKNVKATNGLLTFEQKVREREDTPDGDD